MVGDDDDEKEKSASAAASAQREAFLRRLEESSSHNNTNKRLLVQPKDDEQQQSQEEYQLQVEKQRGATTADGELLDYLANYCQQHDSSPNYVLQDMDESSLIYLREIATSSTKVSSSHVMGYNVGDTSSSSSQQRGIDPPMGHAVSSSSNYTMPSPPLPSDSSPTPNNITQSAKVVGWINEENDSQPPHPPPPVPKSFTQDIDPSSLLSYIPSILRNEKTMSSESKSTSSTFSLLLKAGGGDNEEDKLNNMTSALSMQQQQQQQQILTILEKQQCQLLSIEHYMTSMNAKISQMELTMKQIMVVGGRIHYKQQQPQQPPPPNPPPYPPPQLNNFDNVPPPPPPHYVGVGVVVVPPPPPFPPPPQSLFGLLIDLLGPEQRRQRRQRFHNALRETGIGRVYMHLYHRALDRRAFANFDIGGLFKFLIMIFIFTTGRVGGGGGDAVQVGGIYWLLRYVQRYIHGHSVHALIFASLMGYLIQVGLVSFLYTVLWVERDDLWRVWLGENAVGDEVEEHRHGNGRDQPAPVAPVEDAAAADNNNAVDAAAAAEQRIGRPNNIGDVPVAVVPAGGGMIRRGPNNGGFLHDVQCLIVSFFLSLIPAWRPEEARPR